MLAGRSMLVRRDRTAADRMRRARLPLRIGLEGLRGDRRGLRHRRCRPACWNRSRLPEPIFTPATKAQSGHDINISVDDAGGARRSGRARPRARVDAAALRRRRRARRIARHHRRRHEVRIRPAARRRTAGARSPDPHRRGADARLVALLAARSPTRPGGPQPSFDKQFVRDYLERIQWNKQPPVPSLPDDVVLKTREKYVEAFRRLTGRELA